MLHLSTRRFCSDNRDQLKQPLSLTIVVMCRIATGQRRASGLTALSSPGWGRFFCAVNERGRLPSRRRRRFDVRRERTEVLLRARFVHLLFKIGRLVQ